MRKFSQEDLKDCINKQMEINGYTERYEDLLGIEGWYTLFTTNEEKEKEFIEFLKKEFKKFVPKNRIDKEIGRFILNYGLKKDV